VSIRRVVPDLKTNNLELSKQFYRDVLGFREAMDLGWLVTFASRLLSTVYCLPLSCPGTPDTCHRSKRSETYVHRPARDTESL
jgi:catechol 2,3-dioxygenase-like lactoylglutathione lyase family enzyme